jgi:hypothetical protein
MMHRFQPGQTVRLHHSSRYLSVAAGRYEVRGLLPSEDGDPRYRVRSADEQHDRVVKESELRDDAVAGWPQGAKA